MTGTSGNKTSRVKAAMQRGVNGNNNSQPTKHNITITPESLLYDIIRRVGWPNATWLSVGLKSGKYLVDLQNASYLSPVIISRPLIAKPTNSLRKQVLLARNPLTPSNRLTLPTSQYKSSPDKLSLTPSHFTFPIPDRPPAGHLGLPTESSILAVTISCYKDSKLAAEAMQNVLGTVPNLERYQRCNPPLGDCSLSNGKTIYWINGESFIRVWDTTLGLDARDLHTVTSGIDQYLNDDKIEEEDNEDVDEIHTSIEEPTEDDRVYHSLLSTFQNATTFLNMPLIARKIFTDINTDNWTFRIEEVNEMMKSVNNGLRPDGVFEFLADQVGIGIITFRIRSWRGDMSRLVTVTMKVQARTKQPEEEMVEEGETMVETALVEEGEMCI